MTQFEDFPKICVKCKRSDLELYKFSYGRTKKKIGSSSYTTKFISFPVCSNCKQEFEKSYKIENLFDYFKYASIISTIILIYTVFEAFRGSTFWLIYVLMVITASILIIGIFLFFRIRLDPNRVRNYIDLKKSGEISIKDDKLKQDIEEHLISEIEKEALRKITGEGMIYCPKCGTEQPKGIDFCNKCGKELRNI
ncbi:MAG: zinc ribbon domain-containing protein [Promethearchaeota archaeon]|nr:MAG: zinc ribbon domain-containing protein [Candidatus Lokiarchaeota archaeon]